MKAKIACMKNGNQTMVTDVLRAVKVLDIEAATTHVIETSKMSNLGSKTYPIRLLGVLGML